MIIYQLIPCCNLNFDIIGHGDRQAHWSQTVERRGSMELERRRLELRHLQEQHQWDMSRVPGQLNFW